MDIPYKIYDMVIRGGTMVCAEIPLPAESTRQAFIGVYPLTNNEFNIRYFEVERHLIEINDDIGEFSLLNKEWYRNVTADELWIVLSKWLDDFNDLVQPYRNDYPI
ncbi:hypothetical protein [Herpetosiphon sp. NSE202]|uniref:hypothetical protein n=1 Tax=Herpetosiphon sp. NSE202 TaxID=3351349 RepID=UPI00362FFCF2